MPRRGTIVSFCLKENPYHTTNLRSRGKIKIINLAFFFMVQTSPFFELFSAYFNERHPSPCQISSSTPLHLLQLVQ
jgi:hypothetical protein